MNTKIENYVAKQKKRLNNIARKFDLCWAMDVATNKPVQFEILNIDLMYEWHKSALLPAIQPGMLVKISVDWVSREYMNESFWMKVTNVNVDGQGDVHLFGTCANNTERVSYGSVMGPIYPRNILEVQE
jgi:hypothetical protein